MLRTLGKHVYTTVNFFPKNLIGFQNLLHSMCKQADIHSKALLLDTSKFTSEYSLTAKLFAFEPTDDQHKILRRPQLHADMVAVHLKYFYEDRIGQLQATVNDDKATFFVVSNAYGEHLAGFDHLADAKLYLETHCAKTDNQKDKTQN